MDSDVRGRKGQQQEETGLLHSLKDLTRVEEHRGWAKNPDDGRPHEARIVMPQGSGGTHTTSACGGPDIGSGVPAMPAGWRDPEHVARLLRHPVIRPSAIHLRALFPVLLRPRMPRCPRPGVRASLLRSPAGKTRWGSGVAQSGRACLTSRILPTVRRAQTVEGEGEGKAASNRRHPEVGTTARRRR